MIAASASPHHAFRHGRLVPEPGGRRLGRFTVGGKRLTGISVGASEHLALPRLDRDLEEVGVYLGWFGPARASPRRRRSAWRRWAGPAPVTPCSTGRCAARPRDGEGPTLEGGATPAPGWWP